MDERLENELLTAAKAGDGAAFEKVLLPHLPMVFAYSRAICGDQDAAHDVVQETALIAFRNLSHLFPETDFSAWLKAIARRQALAMRRNLSKSVLATDAVIESVYQDPTPAAAAPRREALTRCMQSLGGRLARVVRDHYLGGQALGELEKAMEMTRHALVQLLYRARLALRECIQKRMKEEVAS